MQRRPLGVDEIHRHLRLAVDLEAQRFDVAQAAGRPAHRFGDLFGDREVRRRAEVDVVGDEEGTGADGDGAGAGCISARSEVGCAHRGPYVIASRRPSNSPRRTSARFSRSGRVAARS